MEMHLRRAEKLATVGQVAAEIAHEVGTPLNVIGGRARTLARRPGDSAEVQKNATIITIRSSASPRSSARCWMLPARTGPA